MIHYITWVWGTKYPPHYLERLQNAVARNSKYNLQMHHPRMEDKHLTDIPGCFARLRTFDRFWQSAHGYAPGDWIVCLDLDLIVTGELDSLFERREESFTILQGINATNPNPYNGSVWALRAGCHQEVWEQFTLDKAQSIPYYAFPDDQAWFHHMIPQAGSVGPEQGVYAFQKPGWPKGVDLPKNARVVAFPGHRDPSQFTGLPWVRDHWR